MIKVLVKPLRSKHRETLILNKLGAPIEIDALEGHDGFHANLSLIEHKVQGNT